MTQQPVDPVVLSTLMRAFDERPDPLHADVTPSVSALIDLGLPGAEAVLDRLNAPARLTRKRAQRVIEAVASRRLGWTPGVGYPSPEAEERLRSIVAAHDYDADADESERLVAIARWREWVATERAREEPQP